MKREILLSFALCAGCAVPPVSGPRERPPARLTHPQTVPPPSLANCEYGRTGIGPSFSWRVVPDGTSPSGYALSAENAGSEVGPDLFLLLPAEFPSLENGDVRIKLNFTDKNAGIAGVLARYRDPHNYDAAVIDIGRNELEILQVRDDRKNVLASAPLEAGGKWTPLSFSIHGDSLKASSRRSMAQAFDNTLKGPGRTGLLTDSVSLVLFTDYRVNPAIPRKRR